MIVDIQLRQCLQQLAPILSTMASPSIGSPKPPHGRVSAKTTTDPILRNTLRYTISSKEYETLHKYIISRSKSLRKNAPSVVRIEKLVDRPGRDDYNAAAVRATLRVFFLTSAGLKAWTVFCERVLGRDRPRYLLRRPTEVGSG